MIQEVPVSEPQEAQEAQEDVPEPVESSASVPQAQQEDVPEPVQEATESEEPPPPVPKTRVPPKVKPRPKAESSASSAPKPKAKRAPKKTEPPEDPEPVDRFSTFSNTDLIAEILARTEDRRMEQKRQLYRSFLL